MRAIQIGSAAHSESFSTTRPRLDVGTINTDTGRPYKCHCLSVCLSMDFNLVNLVLASQRLQGFANHFHRRQMVRTTLEIQHFDIHALPGRSSPSSTGQAHVFPRCCFNARLHFCRSALSSVSSCWSSRILIATSASFVFRNSRTAEHACALSPRTPINSLISCSEKPKLCIRRTKRRRSMASLV